MSYVISFHEWQGFRHYHGMCVRRVAIGWITCTWTRITVEASLDDLIRKTKVSDQTFLAALLDIN